MIVSGILLFQTIGQKINFYIHNIFEEDEPGKISDVKEHLATAPDRKKY